MLRPVLSALAPLVCLELVLGKFEWEYGFGYYEEPLISGITKLTLCYPLCESNVRQRWPLPLPAAVVRRFTALQ